ncbi:MAG: permease [Alphaproteobacteria bacterium HGW-Alphaproteobacteria-16]|nr:MAG: permease [Alphaproteobacteria bacterium HGW-Alphaproteobacteria-16]
MTLALMAFALAACSTVSAPSAPTASAPAYPLPVLTGRVVDNADLLTPAQEAKLVEALAETERATRHQFVVVTLPTLAGRSIEQVGLELGNGWGIGRKGYNDGVLLIVAPRERKVRIEVGCGLEIALTNQEAQEIIDRDMLPRFRKGAMAAGIFRGSASIIREIDGPGATQ